MSDTNSTTSNFAVDYQQPKAAPTPGVTAADREDRNRRRKTLASRVVCVLVIALVWGLLSLPAVFEFLPGEEVSDMSVETGVKEF